MSDTLAVQVGHKGRIVVPASIRARHQWREGSTLVAVDTDSGVFLADRSALESILRARLAGIDLVSELISDRRQEASDESTESTT
ncbi:MAG: AbrB/MazE/SpoVT family DNA-binding domain-containing protein [Microcella sp.]|uniref:AbrB/MazE/SpoVT family DNA-binding domain-containing protein n=1 Tax=Microcella sp. TaxID=1913979 RepID=UPI0033146E54